MIVGGDGKQSTSHIACGTLCHLLVASPNRALDVNNLTVLVDSLKSHTAWQTLDKCTALRIELHDQFILLRLWQTGLRSLVDTAQVVVASLLGLAIYR